jgi:hypothetical protein
MPVQRKEMAAPSFAFPNLNQSFNAVTPQQSSVLKPEPVNTFAVGSVSDDESERLSDIPSDLESPPPSDFGSPEKKTIELTLTPKKTRGRPRKNVGRVIEI